MSENITPGNLDVSGRTEVKVADQAIFQAKHLSQANISVKNSEDGVHFYAVTLTGTDPVDPIYYVYQESYFARPDSNIFFSDVVVYKKSVDERSIKKSKDGWEFDVLYKKKSLAEVLDPGLLGILAFISIVGGAAVGFLGAYAILVLLAIIQLIIDMPGFIRRITSR